MGCLFQARTFFKPMPFAEMLRRQAGGACGLPGCRLHTGQGQIGSHGEVPCCGEHRGHVEAEGAVVGVGKHVAGFVIAGVVGHAAGAAPQRSLLYRLDAVVAGEDAADGDSGRHER